MSSERPLMAGIRQTNPDFAQWGRSFGAEGITIKSVAEVADGIAPPFCLQDPAGSGALCDLGRTR
jgi:acetolactate synthase-1/2/3 large subunit